jgi:CheY-like chemotaxis protein
MAEQERVLVVDDEPSIRKYLQTLLEVDGFHVTAVASGAEALEQVHLEKPNFVILTCSCPKWTG